MRVMVNLLPADNLAPAKVIFLLSLLQIILNTTLISTPAVKRGYPGYPVYTRQSLLLPIFQMD